MTDPTRDLAPPPYFPPLRGDPLIDHDQGPLTGLTRSTHHMASFSFQQVDVFTGGRPERAIRWRWSLAPMA